MAVMDDVADELAVEALKLEDKTGDENTVKKIADALASSSPTMEETFLTAVRIRRAERRAWRLIETMKRDIAASGASPAPAATEPDGPSAPGDPA